MAKEFEKAGLPTVQVCTITSIALSLGVSRIVPALGIPHPLGDPRLSRDEEQSVRKALVHKALRALGLQITEPQVLT